MYVQYTDVCMYVRICKCLLLFCSEEKQRRLDVGALRYRIRIFINNTQAGHSSERLYIASLLVVSLHAIMK